VTGEPATERSPAMQGGRRMGRIEEIWKGDRLIQDFGMRLLAGGEGYAKVAVTVEERFRNAHGVAHGALVFAVADAAFALSVNAVVDAVGVQWSLNIMRAAKPGEDIVGESRIIHRGRQSMVVDLLVTGGDGRLLAKGQATAMPVSREAYKGKAPGPPDGPPAEKTGEQSPLK
jgi:acyl-CoA thioesterase